MYLYLNIQMNYFFFSILLKEINEMSRFLKIRKSNRKQKFHKKIILSKMTEIFIVLKWYIFGIQENFIKP